MPGGYLVTDHDSCLHDLLKFTESDSRLIPFDAI